MLPQYIDLAMELAVYDIIEDDASYWGDIPGFQGVWARHQTLAGCQRELREALSDWIALRLRLGLEIPELARMNLNHIGALDKETSAPASCIACSSKLAFRTRNGSENEHPSLAKPPSRDSRGSRA